MTRPVIAFAALAAASFIAAPGAEAQSLAGSWRAFANINGANVEFDMTIQPNMVFTQSQKSMGGMTLQTGEVQVTGPGTVTFVVEDWQPKSMPSYSPDPAAGGAIDWHQIPTSKPPGGTWTVQFNGPNSLTMHDVYMGGTLAYQRVG